MTNFIIFLCSYLISATAFSNIAVVTSEKASKLELNAAVMVLLILDAAGALEPMT